MIRCNFWQSQKEIRARVGLISSRFGSPVVDPPLNCGVGQGTRAQETAGLEPPKLFENLRWL